MEEPPNPEQGRTTAGTKACATNEATQSCWRRCSSPCSATSGGRVAAPVPHRRNRRPPRSSMNGRLRWTTALGLLHEGSELVTAPTQGQEPGGSRAMLSIMCRASGRWFLAVKGPKSNGLRLDATYSFNGKPPLDRVPKERVIQDESGVHVIADYLILDLETCSRGSVSPTARKNA